MSYLHIAPPRLLTVADYLAIGEIEPGYTELFEGRVLPSPTPGVAHSRAMSEFAFRLHEQVPEGMAAIHALDVDLQLAPPDKPGFVRRPDLIVIRPEARIRVRHDDDVIKASEVVVAVEFVTPESRRTDLVAKRHDYADAGIPHYWIVDISEPVTLLACHLAGEFGYADGGEVSGRFTTTEPFPFEIDLDSLL
jgi:Uma2 family endonuclease